MSHTPQAAAAIVGAWNRNHPIGTTVIFIMDDGKECPTRTRSEAYLISGRRADSESLPVIMIDAKRGCVLLSRVIFAGTELARTISDSAEDAAAPTVKAELRIFVEGGCCHSVRLKNLTPDITLDIEAEIFDGDGDFREEHNNALDGSDNPDWQSLI